MHWIAPMRHFHYPLMCCLTLLLLAGCAKKEESYNPEAASAPAAEASSSKSGGSVPTPQRTLAYVHHYDFNVAESGVKPAYDAVLKACAALPADCTVLESGLTTGDIVRADLKFRVSPAARAPLVKALGKSGEITRSSTTAEDLAGPIADTGKKLAMQQAYRDSLRALQAKPGHDIDSLIKINQELAAVQGNIEALSGEQAQLLQRVDTEIVEMQIASTMNQNLMKPVSESLQKFGWHLSWAISGIIIAMAYIVPWGLLLMVLLLVIRKVSRRVRGRR